MRVYLKALGGIKGEADCKSIYMAGLPAFLGFLRPLFLTSWVGGLAKAPRNEKESPYLQNLEHDLIEGKAFFRSGPVPSRHLKAMVHVFRSLRDAGKQIFL